MKSHSSSFLGFQFVIILLIAATNTSFYGYQSKNSDIFTKKYFVSFYANHPNTGCGSGEDFSPGHIWVGFKSPQRKFQLGYYPEGLQAESTHADVSFTFPVTRQQFDIAVDVISIYHDNSYIIGVNDCRSFAELIARTIDLELPNKGIKSPAIWLSELVELNPDR